MKRSSTRLREAGLLLDLLDKVGSTSVMELIGEIVLVMNYLVVTIFSHVQRKNSLILSIVGVKNTSRGDRHLG